MIGFAQRRQRARLSQLLDLFGEDSRRINVYEGELEVRPPGAPTTKAGYGGVNATVRDGSLIR